MRSLIAALLPALLLTGCASTTDVATRYTSDGSFPKQDQLLLVAHTPEGSVRETWELTCRDIFSSDSLTILLSHQELPLWYEGGKQRILHWAQETGVDRILVVELTHLLIDAAEPPQPVNQLNAMNQTPGSLPPTWEVGIGGDLRKADIPEALRQHGAELINAEGNPIWTGVATTHEANNMAVIAKSQCQALRKTLREQGYL
ncbi:hypothetical protein [Alcanivorax sediminis]|uniref:Uncharacterized protein n=1 Tax=Alcanivorax sediminis TaxID=2663008 RepID=A0A6N7LXA6_9GAMM|nr:hypothetical protein [Alcanivorax sediminis]MQX53735.1 hypothetical protein [Alcanivorax sediminis]